MPGIKIPWKQRIKDKFTYPDDWAETDACWEWTGAINSNGYGNFSMSKYHQVQAHRAMWKLYHGDFPPDGLFVLHRCDNRKCVNINHLFVGTAKDNSQDMVTKNRSCRASRQHCCRHTEEEVLLVKKRLLENDRIVDISKDLGISVGVIQKIKRGDSWSWLQPS